MEAIGQSLFSKANFTLAYRTLISFQTVTVSLTELCLMSCNNDVFPNLGLDLTELHELD